jgi:hypothetical protein
MSPNPDGSIRIVCEGGDAESVAAAAREGERLLLLLCEHGRSKHINNALILE